MSSVRPGTASSLAAGPPLSWAEANERATRGQLPHHEVDDDEIAAAAVLAEQSALEKWPSTGAVSQATAMLFGFANGGRTHPLRVLCLRLQPQGLQTHRHDPDRQRPLLLSCSVSTFGCLPLRPRKDLPPLQTSHRHGSLLLPCAQLAEAHFRNLILQQRRSWRENSEPLLTTLSQTFVWAAAPQQVQMLQHTSRRGHA